MRSLCRSLGHACYAAAVLMAIAVCVRTGDPEAFGYVIMAVAILALDAIHSEPAPA